MRNIDAFALLGIFPPLLTAIKGPRRFLLVSPIFTLLSVAAFLYSCFAYMIESGELVTLVLMVIADLVEAFRGIVRVILITAVGEEIPLTDTEEI